MKLTIPFPPPQLSPNSRAHWKARSPIKNKYQLACRILAFNANSPAMPKTGNIPLVINFYPPNLKSDLDNMLASIKYGLDAIAQVIKVNDKRFRPITIDCPGSDKANPRVEIQIITDSRQN